MRYKAVRIGRWDLQWGGTAIMLAAMLCFGALKMGSIYGFLIFPDEFAYWSHAAWAAGYDWSDITSLGPYFSYGYAILLFPIFKLCKDAVTAYRIAVSLNYGLLIASYFLLTRTVRKMAPDRTAPVPAFAALAILVPWNLFYAQMTMTETLLLFLYIAVGYLLLCYLESDRLSVLLLLLLTLAYAYTVHMRTVGILASAVIVLAAHILFLEGKKWHLPVVLGITALTLIAAACVKNYALGHVYEGISPALVADNDYSGQLVKLRYICTGEGLRDLAVTVLGGIMYLGLATFGVFYWGIYALIRSALPLFHRSGARVRKTERTSEEVQDGAADADVPVRAELALFFLLTVAAQLVIASVHLLQIGEVDDYTYGRYGELTVPFVMVMGFAALWKAERRRALAVTGSAAMLHAALLFLVVRQIAHTGAKKYLGYFMVGISYLYRPEGYTPGRFYAGAWFFCEFLTLLVALLVFWCRSHAGGRYLLALLAVAELALAVHADNLYLMPFKNAAFRDTRVADRIVSVCVGDDRDVIYMDSCRPAYIGILQFMARDTDIRIMQSGEEAEKYAGKISADDILVLAFDDENAAKWAGRYTYEDTYGHFTILYND